MTKNIIKFGIAKKYIEDYVGNESWQFGSVDKGSFPGRGSGTDIKSRVSNIVSMRARASVI